MAADVGIAVKGSGAGTAVTSSGTSQATASTFYIFAHWDTGSTFTSVADSKSNTYTLVGAEQAIGAFRTRLYRCVNGTGGASHTATLVVSGAGGATVYLVEATGCNTSSPVDQSDRRTESASPYTLAAGLTTTQANELLLSFFAGDSGSNPATNAESGLGSSTIVVEETNGAANWTGAVAKSYKTSTGTFNPSWTQTGTVDGAVFLETLKEAGTGPTINTQPASQQIPDQTRVQVSVTATTSGGALSYQWQDNRSGSFANTTDGDNATSATYTTPALYVRQSPRQYRCVVTDSNGSVNSNAATITVAPRDFRPELTRKRRVVGGITQLNDIRGWWG